MLNKFNFNNYLINTSFNKDYQYINLNIKKNKRLIINLPKCELRPTMNNISYTCLYENKYLDEFLNIYKYDKKYCNNVYKYILKLSEQSNYKHKLFPECKNKYLVNKEWLYQHIMKGYTFNYSHVNNSEEIIYNKVIGNILELYQEKNKCNYKIKFSRKIVKKILEKPCENIYKFLKTHFLYDEELNKLNEEILLKCLNDMVKKLKHDFLNLLFESYDLINGKYKIESSGVDMELDYKNKKCFVNIKWNVTKLIIM